MLRGCTDYFGESVDIECRENETNTARFRVRARRSAARAAEPERCSPDANAAGADEGGFVLRATAGGARRLR